MQMVGEKNLNLNFALDKLKKIRLKSDFNVDTKSVLSVSC